MRVVWITHNYPRFAGDVAGNFLHPLAVALRRHGVDVRVVAPADEGKGGRDELDGVPIVRVRYDTPAHERIAYRGTMASAISTPRGLLALYRLRRALERAARNELDSEPGSVVHAHWWIPSGLAAPRSRPLVLTCHGTDVRLLQHHAVARWLGAPVFRRAAVVTTVSRSLATAITRTTGVAVADDAVQPMPLLPLSRPVTSGQGGVVVLGRLTAQKRVDLAVRATAIARQSMPELSLTIVGDGPERGALEELARVLAVPTTFTGAVAPSQVPEFLAQARCCLMPAREEGFGLAAAEAVIQHVPLVACHDGGGVIDVAADPAAGRITDPEPAAIAAALLDLLQQHRSSSSMTTVAAQWREQLDADHVAKRCMVWYQRALDV